MHSYTQPLGCDPVWMVEALLPLNLANAVIAESSKNWIVGVLFSAIRDLTWPQLLGAITLPICAAKQVINCVQFWKAAKVLVGVDLAEREKARQKKG